jgi:hypothetical protein
MTLNQSPRYHLGIHYIEILQDGHQDTPRLVTCNFGGCEKAKRCGQENWSCEVSVL